MLGLFDLLPIAKPKSSPDLPCFPLPRNAPKPIIPKPIAPVFKILLRRSSFGFSIPSNSFVCFSHFGIACSIIIFVNVESAISLSLKR